MRCTDQNLLAVFGYLQFIIQPTEKRDPGYGYNQILSMHNVSGGFVVFNDRLQRLYTCFVVA